MVGQLHRRRGPPLHSDRSTCFDTTCSAHAGTADGRDHHSDHHSAATARIPHTGRSDGGLHPAVRRRLHHVRPWFEHPTAATLPIRRRGSLTVIRYGSRAGTTGRGRGRREAVNLLVWQELNWTS